MPVNPGTGKPSSSSKAGANISYWKDFMIEKSLDDIVLERREQYNDLGILWCDPDRIAKVMPEPGRCQVA